MNAYIKKSIIIILIAVLSVCTIPTRTVQAATKGSIYNPFNLKTGGKCSATWPATDSANKGSYYATFKMKDRGYATITLSKSRVPNAYEVLSLTLMNASTHETVWKSQANSRDYATSKNICYKVGLNKGSYYLQIAASFPLSGYSQKFKHSISIKTTKNAYWEDESSKFYSVLTSDQQDENIIKLNKKYTGVAGDKYIEDLLYLKTEEVDRYKVYLKKGKKYKIQIGNIKALRKVGLFGVLNTKAKQVYEYNKLPLAASSLYNNGSAVIKADSTGYYTILVDSYKGYIPNIKNGITGVQYTLKVSPIR